MNVTPIPSSWIDGDDVILQGPVGDYAGYTVRVPIDVLHGMWEESRSSDKGTARWEGFAWDRDHIAGAMRLAIDSGLIDTCQAVDGRQMCERPLPWGATRCPNHEIGATA